MPISRKSRFAVLLIALPLLAGCSAAGGNAATSAGPSSKASSSGSSSSAAAKAPCDYLSTADAATILGTPVTSAEADGACSYSGAGAVGFATTVNGGITGASDPVWKNEVKALKDEDGPVTTLSGVGDEAYGGVGSVEVKIVVRSGQWVIEVADADDSSTTTFPNSIAVAKAIIANLG
jgi:hypothetical protein